MGVAFTFSEYNDMKPKKISIIGVGLMGGSLALALKKVYPKSYLWGYARSSRSFKKLKKLKITDVVHLI